MVQANVPAVAQAFFRLELGGERAAWPGGSVHPVIDRVFVETPNVSGHYISGTNTGWKRLATRKRISVSVARALRGDGVTAVALRVGHRVADFRIDELVK